MGENKVVFGTLLPNGRVINLQKIPQSQFVRCPFFIFDPSHYREDGSCKCNDPVYRKTVMKKWGYSKKDFVRVGVIK